MRFLLISAGKIKLFLYIARLYAGDGGFCRLRAGACGEYGDGDGRHRDQTITPRSEEHTSELQSLTNLVCRLLLEKKKKKKHTRARCKPKNTSTTHSTHLQPT